MANDLGIDVMEKNLTRDEVYTADEAFFTGTAAEVTPIKQLDRRNIGNGSKGEITDKIQSLYFDIVQGENEQYKNWLTYIS
jgi:branched-chain amino acid aminotransferase